MTDKLLTVGCAICLWGVNTAEQYNLIGFFWAYLVAAIIFYFLGKLGFKILWGR